MALCDRARASFSSLCTWLSHLEGDITNEKKKNVFFVSWFWFHFSIYLTYSTGLTFHFFFRGGRASQYKSNDIFCVVKKNTSRNKRKEINVNDEQCANDVGKQIRQQLINLLICSRNNPVVNGWRRGPEKNFLCYFLDSCQEIKENIVFLQSNWTFFKKTWIPGERGANKQIMCENRIKSIKKNIYDMTSDAYRTRFAAVTVNK